MITSIRFKNFKSLNDFSISLKDFNVLTGPNNSGKSTILDGIRVLQGAYRYASRINPQFIRTPAGVNTLGYQIPDTSIPIILENIQTDLNTDEPSIIKYRFSGGQTIYIAFQADEPTFLYFDSPRKTPKSASSFRTEFPVNVSVVPTLGPFSIEEDMLDPAYIQRWYGSRRAPRLFRNYWYYNSERFNEFKSLVEETWPGMSVSAPQRRGGLSTNLIMFCEENRIPREICWAGFGFQIWLQLLTHVMNSSEADLLVVDEPEIYLHPDLQHKILDLLKTSNSRTVLATHSVEIINSVDPSEVLLIDKQNTSAKRITDLAGLQNVSNLLGSGQNIQLTRLARGKKILFVEGQDLKILSKLSKICGRGELFTTGEVTTIPIEGFSQHNKIIHTNWAFSQILGENIRIAVLLDRDYRGEAENNRVIEKLNKEVDFAHILAKKEIENFLIVPAAIEKAVMQKIAERRVGPEEIEGATIDVRATIDSVVEDMKVGTLSQLIGHRIKSSRTSGIDPATITEKLSNQFEADWKVKEFRYSSISGKIFFTNLNVLLQNQYGVSITNNQVATFIHKDELGEDLIAFFTKLESFRTTKA